MSARSFAVVPCLAFLGCLHAADAYAEPLLPPGPIASTPGQYRAQVLHRASQQLDHWYELANSSYAHEPVDAAAGVAVRVSREHFPCAGADVPYVVVEFDVPDVRPVDVLNVLLDCPILHGWDARVSSCNVIDYSRVRQARGARRVVEVSGDFHHKAEETVWQVVHGNVTSGDDFHYVQTNSENEGLYNESAVLPPLMTSADLCLSATRITRNGTSAHVIKSVLVNPHCMLFSAPDCSMSPDHEFDVITHWATDLRAQSVLQSKKNLSSEMLAVDPWMNEHGHCVRKAPDTPYRNGLLDLASLALQVEGQDETEAGAVLEGRTVPLSFSRRLAPCGGVGVQTRDVPVWRGAFTVPNASALEVFAALAGRMEEPRSQGELLSAWPLLDEVLGGVRKMQLQYAYNVSGTEMSREVFEWQAANHTIGGGTYLLASRSNASGENYSEVTARRLRTNTQTPNTSIEEVLPAMNCLSTFQVSDSDSGIDATVQFSLHVNPNFGPEYDDDLDEHGRNYVLSLVKGVTTHAVRLHEARDWPSKVNPLVDIGLLALLLPPVMDSNPTETLSRVLHFPSPQNVFTTLDLLLALNISDWTSFEDGASALVALLDLLRSNMTDSELLICCSGVARDALEVLLQGQVLGVVQQKFVSQVEGVMCPIQPSPDIIPPVFKPWDYLVVLLGVLASVVVVGSLAASYAVKRSETKRLIAEKRVGNEAEALAEVCAAASFARNAGPAMFGSNFSIRSPVQQQTPSSSIRTTSDVELAPPSFGNSSIP